MTKCKHILTSNATPLQIPGWENSDIQRSTMDAVTFTEVTRRHIKTARLWCRNIALFQREKERFQKLAKKSPEAMSNYCWDIVPQETQCVLATEQKTLWGSFSLCLIWKSEEASERGKERTGKVGEWATGRELVIQASAEVRERLHFKCNLSTLF